MAKLAIKGHTTRGKEVIEILEMLGGKNVYQYEGCNVCSCLFIDEVANAIHSELLATIYCKINVKHHILTLEEFLEKFPYKVGDKVCFPDDLSTPFTINKMWWDENANELLCSFIEDDIEVPVVGIRTYKEETMKETNKTIFEGNAHCCDIMNDIIKDNIEETEEGVYAYNEINCYHQDFGDKVRIRLGDDFEIKVEDKLTYIVRKKPQYPKTYKECCGVLGMTYDYPDIQMVSIEECNLYSSFIQLIRCRNAYWKIAGDEMGLGKPWEPNFEPNDEEEWQERYGIYIAENKIKKDYWGGGDVNIILTFPTEEMRDAFYENFKDLIEECKVLL
jgi:hypothetical protein